MPELTKEQVVQPKLLESIVLKYMNEDYVGNGLFPIVNVPQFTGVYLKFPKSVWFRNEARVVAAGVVAPDIEFNVDMTETFRCKTTKIRGPILREIKANAEPGIKLQTQLAMMVADKLMLSREIVISGLIFTAAAATTWSTYQTNTLGEGTFWNQATATPIDDIYAMKRGIRRKTAGKRMNKCVFGPDTWDDFRVHPQTLSFIFGGGSGPKIVTPALAAAALEVESVQIGYAQYTSSPEGTAEASVTFADAWGPHFWGGHVTNAPSTIEPSAGYQFREFMRTRGYTVDETETEYIEGAESLQIKVVAPDCGAYIFNATASTA